MGVDLQRGRHWAAGSYIDFMLAAAVMQIVFLICILWLVFGSDSNFVIDNLVEILFVVRMQAGLGWLMAITAGIGFSILPLIYDVHKFDRSMLHVFITLNIIGQVCIVAGIMTGDLEIFHTLSTIALTLLATAMISIGPQALKVFKARNAEEGKMGPFSFAPGIFLPIVGLLILSCWATRSIFSNALLFADDLVLYFLLPLVIMAALVSHFNRRLNWEIMSPEKIGRNFSIFILLLLVQLIGEQFHLYGMVSTNVDIVIHGAPYIFGFLIMRPDIIARNLWNKLPCSKPMVMTLVWFPIVGITSMAESNGLLVGNNIFSKWIFLIACCMQGLWGFAWYLHEDHKRLSIHRRKTNWPIILTLNLGTLCIVWSMFSTSIMSDYYSVAISNTFIIATILHAIAYLLILSIWIKDIFFGLDDWYKVPMFYDKYLAHPELGSGNTPK
jgi:hypothetical protein